KLAPSEHFSIEAGKLPTLIGAEYTFSFENMNIERGLLWNQENAVNRGIQVNGSAGPLSLAASWNDGMYSNRFDWLTFSASVRVNKTDTVTLAAGGATRRETVSSAATPPTLNNQRIVNLIYARSAGPW